MMGGIFLSLLCFVLSISNIGIDLWQHDLNSLGGWVSAACAWAVVSIKEYKELKND